MLLIAMASSAIEMRSPVVSSMSISRASGIGVTSCARSTSSSVVSPIAETATTTSLPALRVSTMRLATRLMLSASATLEPPYFWTIKLTRILQEGPGWSNPTDGAGVLPFSARVRTYVREAAIPQRKSVLSRI